MIVTTTLKLIFIYRELSIPQLILYMYTKYHVIPTRNKSKFNFQICETRISKLHECRISEKNLATISITSILVYPREKIKLISKERKSRQPPKKPSVVLVISNKCCTRRPYPERGSMLVLRPAKENRKVPRPVPRV